MALLAQTDLMGPIFLGPMWIFIGPVKSWPDCAGVRTLIELRTDPNQMAVSPRGASKKGDPLQSGVCLELESPETGAVSSFPLVSLWFPFRFPLVPTNSLKHTPDGGSDFGKHLYTSAVAALPGTLWVRSFAQSPIWLQSRPNGRRTGSARPMPHEFLKHKGGRASP